MTSRVLRLANRLIRSISTKHQSEVSKAVESAVSTTVVLTCNLHVTRQAISQLKCTYTRSSACNSSVAWQWYSNGFDSRGSCQSKLQLPIEVCWLAHCYNVCCTRRTALAVPTRYRKLQTTRPHPVASSKRCAYNVHAHSNVSVNMSSVLRKLRIFARLKYSSCMLVTVTS